MKDKTMRRRFKKLSRKKRNENCGVDLGLNVHPIRRGLGNEFYCNKKITFEDSTEKKYIKSYYKGWRRAEIINRRLLRRRLKAGLKKEYSEY
jgi:hypothetical protein